MWPSAFVQLVGPQEEIGVRQRVQVDGHLGVFLMGVVGGIYRGSGLLMRIGW